MKMQNVIWIENENGSFWGSTVDFAPVLNKTVYKNQFGEHIPESVDHKHSYADAVQRCLELAIKNGHPILGAEQVHFERAINKMAYRKMESVSFYDKRKDSMTNWEQIDICAPDDIHKTDLSGVFGKHANGNLWESVLMDVLDGYTENEIAVNVKKGVRQVQRIKFNIVDRLRKYSEHDNGRIRTALSKDVRSKDLSDLKIRKVYNETEFYDNRTAKHSPPSAPFCTLHPFCPIHPVAELKKTESRGELKIWESPEMVNLKESRGELQKWDGFGLVDVDKMNFLNNKESQKKMESEKTTERMGAVAAAYLRRTDVDTFGAYLHSDIGTVYETHSDYRGSLKERSKVINQDVNDDYENVFDRYGSDIRILNR